MTDDKPNVIPFGKYKGRLIEELLSDDPGYLEWLAGQGWFRAKILTADGDEPEVRQNFENYPCVFAALRIELKPTIGDDYPAVLRQMKANGSTVLFVGDYRGQGATREQFIKTFATAGMRVVFADEIEGALTTEE